MWKKWMLLGGLFICLGLPAFAAAAAAPEVAGAVRSIPVDLKGKLLRMELNDVLQPAVRVPEPRIPALTAWEIVADGQAYELDLANRHDLWVLAERFVDQTVRVKGTWDGSVLHVASLQGDVEHVRKTVTVEVKGRLHGISIIDPVVPLSLPEDLARPSPFAFTWQIQVGDKAYTLDFEGAEGLLSRAQALDGRAVIVTGVQAGDTIQVAALQADDEYLKVKETAVELKGKLQYVITMWDTGEVVMVTDDLPEDASRCWTVNLGMVIDGQTYIFNFAGKDDLRQRAEQFIGGTVDVAGVLDGSHVNVASLLPEDRLLEVPVAK
jgi:hypothetical protein